MAGPASFLIEKFPERFPRSAQPALYRAPGRVNLIGEHTDYNEGLVLPIALEMACYTAVSPGSAAGQLRIYSEDLLKGAECLAEAISEAKPRHDWTDYVFGVAQQLVSRGHTVPPLDLLIHSTVPVGAGLSSSAALEISSALALSEGAALADKMNLVRLGRAAENEFVGVPCGIMDQFIAVFGRENTAIKIDCRSLEYEEVQLPSDVVIIAVNTMVKHELGASAYRQRVAECRQAVEYIQRKHSAVNSLRDATLDMLDEGMAEVPRKRARHVISENQRVEEFAKASRGGDRKLMGELFVASHRSLQHDYEVSCLELDYLVDTATQMPGVFGSRMTGGGFGGCTVNLLDPAAVERFRSDLTEAYQKRFEVLPQMYDCRPAAGAGPV
jgi:galactokinase